MLRRGSNVPLSRDVIPPDLHPSTVWNCFLKPPLVSIVWANLAARQWRAHARVATQRRPHKADRTKVRIHLCIHWEPNPPATWRRNHGTYRSGLLANTCTAPRPARQTVQSPPRRGWWMHPHRSATLAWPTRLMPRPRVLVCFSASWCITVWQVHRVGSHQRATC